MADRKKFLQLARERFEMAQTAEQDQRDRERDDLRFYAGDQWDNDLLKSRQGQTIGTGNNQQVVPARPSLTINKTRQHVLQIINDARQNRTHIKFRPTGGGATCPRTCASAESGDDPPLPRRPPGAAVVRLCMAGGRKVAL